MSIINWHTLTDSTTVARLGQELKRMRLEKNLSQADIAQHTGLDRSTIQRLEGGRAATLLTVVQVLRALDRLDLLDPWVHERRATPMMLLEQEEAYQRKKRKRAGRHRPPVVPPKPKSTW
jgi:transcriptional regulator with XRE-family HTH domain